MGIYNQTWYCFNCHKRLLESDIYAKIGENEEPQCPYCKSNILMEIDEEIYLKLAQIEDIKNKVNSVINPSEIILTIIGTKKVTPDTSEYKIYSKDEALKRIAELMDEDYGFSIIEARK